MSIVELHEVKRHLHYADDSNDVDPRQYHGQPIPLNS